MLPIWFVSVARVDQVTRSTLVSKVYSRPGVNPFVLGVYNVPAVTSTIRKCVTSGPSSAFLRRTTVALVLSMSTGAATKGRNAKP